MIKESDLYQCQRCGYCCQGETTVSLDAGDIERMLKYLKMDRDQVAKRYWRITGNIIQMKTPDGHCIFYNRGCTVHPGRPWRCAQWPLHPAILNDESAFLAIKESCPGINRELSYEEFRERLAELLQKAEDE